MALSINVDLARRRAALQSSNQLLQHRKDALMKLPINKKDLLDGSIPGIKMEVFGENQNQVVIKSLKGQDRKPVANQYKPKSMGQPRGGFTQRGSRRGASSNRGPTRKRAPSVVPSRFKQPQNKKARFSSYKPQNSKR